MCTVTWSKTNDGYQLFFNRDERRSRAEALPPRLESSDGSSWLAPRDAEAGGTWVAVNNRGLTVGLLNLYQAEAALPSREGKTSRGLLVRSLANSPDQDAAAACLLAHDLNLFMPFTLVVASPSGEVHSFAWDGREAGVWRPASPPIVSSGHDVVGATAARRRLFAGFGQHPDFADLLTFHSSHEPAKGAYSPCMHRADAKTVSLTAVRVSRDAVEMAYAPGSPCRTGLGTWLRLARSE